MAMQMRFSRILAWILRRLREGAVLVVVALLVFLATGRNGDLIAWPSEKTVIYPSQQTRDLPLPLSLGQTPAKSVTFVTMNVSNAGKAAIGTQEKLWSFRITGPSEATLVTVGAPRGSSSRLVLSLAQSPSVNGLVVRVGSLEPREFFDVTFLVVNATHPGYPRMEVSTDLEGLPPPILTPDSPRDRAARKVFPWLLLVLFAILTYEAIRDRNDANKSPGILASIQNVRVRLASRIVWGVLLAAFSAYFVSEGIGWIAVSLWRLGVVS